MLNGPQSQKGDEDQEPCQSRGNPNNPARDQIIAETWSPNLVCRSTKPGMPKAWCLVMFGPNAVFPEGCFRFSWFLVLFGLGALVSEGRL